MRLFFPDFQFPFLVFFRYSRLLSLLSFFLRVRDLSLHKFPLRNWFPILFISLVLIPLNNIKINSNRLSHFRFILCSFLKSYLICLWYFNHFFFISFSSSDVSVFFHLFPNKLICYAFKNKLYNRTFLLIFYLRVKINFFMWHTCRWEYLDTCGTTNDVNWIRCVNNDNPGIRCLFAFAFVFVFVWATLW